MTKVVTFTPSAPELSTRVSVIFPFPIEIVENILILCCIEDVISFSRTCRLAHIIVFDGSDSHLWRELFLRYPFDDPRQSLKVIPSGNNDVTTTDWRCKLMERIMAERTTKQLIAPTTPNSLFSHALQVFISVVQDVPPETRGSGTLAPSFDLEWLQRVLRGSELLKMEISDPHYLSVLLARLRAYVALSLDDRDSNKNRLLVAQYRKRSRLYVYDFRNYIGRHQGPFLDNSKTDWIHLEHLVNVVITNLRELPDRWSRITPPVGFGATRPYSAPVNGLECQNDWARVAGTWRRYVCFMDFRDLFAFNLEVNEETNSSFFDSPNFREATRLLELKLHLINAEHSRLRNYAWPTKAMKHIHERFPPIFFAGTSRGYSGYEARVEGVVHMNPDGVVRWQFSTTTPETTRWWADGAQIGNIASASGVVGVWSTEFRRRDDPVGPFWLWKVEDDFPVQLMEFST